MSIENEASALLAPLSYTDPQRVHEIMAKLRSEKPVCKVEAEGINPVWLISRNEDVAFIESNSDIFHAGPRPTVRTVAEDMALKEQRKGGQVLPEMDGDKHRKYRQITQAWFMHPNLKTLDGSIKAAAKRYVDLMQEQAPTCDFASDVAFWYPLRVVMSLAGIPETADEEFIKLTQSLFAPADSDNLAGEQLTNAQASQRIFELLQPFVEERKANPGDDLISVIVRAEIDGQPLSLPDILSYLLIITTAGHDTTSASLAGGILALMENPEQLERLKQEPELIPSAVDEILRWVAPVKHFARTAMKDVEIGGVTIPEGDSVMVLFASACRDEALFPDGDKFRIDRKPNKHLAFGTGPHMCLGRYLANMELEAYLTELLPRLDTIELTGEPKYMGSSLVSGLKSLPVTYSFK